MGIFVQNRYFGRSVAYLESGKIAVKGMVCGFSNCTQPSSHYQVTHVFDLHGFDSALKKMGLVKLRRSLLDPPIQLRIVYP